MATIQGYYQGVPIYQGEDYVARIREIDATGATTTREQARTAVATNTSYTEPFRAMVVSSLESGYAKMDATQPPTTTATYQTPYPAVDPATAIAGMQAEVETARATLEERIADEQKAWEKKAATYQKQADALSAEMKSTIQETDPTQTAIYQQKERIVQNLMDVSESESNLLQADFTARRKAVDELEALWTQAANEINLMNSQTGLSAIRAPRIQKTIDDYNARKNILLAVIAGREGNIEQAKSIIDFAFSRDAEVQNQKINYYNTLLRFYASEQGRKDALASESRAYAQDYAMTQIKVLQNELAIKQESAEYIKRLMVDPATAGALQGAGITTNMSIDEINQKLGEYANQQDARDFANKLALEGFTPALQGQVGAVEVQNPDGSTSWYKPEATTSSTTIKNTIGESYTSRLSEEIKNVYSGKYGKTGGREQAIAILQREFPNMDVQGDIYSRIPDGYEKQVGLTTTGTEQDAVIWSGLAENQAAIDNGTISYETVKAWIMEQGRNPENFGYY